MYVEGQKGNSEEDGYFYTGFVWGPRGIFFFGRRCGMFACILVRVKVSRQVRTQAYLTECDIDGNGGGETKNEKKTALAVVLTSPGREVFSFARCIYFFHPRRIMLCNSQFFLHLRRIFLIILHAILPHFPKAVFMYVFLLLRLKN